MEHIREFSKNVHTYDAHTRVQKEVVQDLLSFSKHKPKRILDLGCGTGEIYKNIDWTMEHFYAVDLSSKMCDLHPKSENISIFNGNFEAIDTQKWLVRQCPIEHIYSASALQWAKNISMLLEFMPKISSGCSLAIFTDKTFETLYSVSKVPKFLPEADFLKKEIQKHYAGDFMIKEYKQKFSNKKELFTYLKKSGVSGGKRHLSFKQTKNLLEEYPHTTLEFEVLFFTSK